MSKPEPIGDELLVVLGEDKVSITVDAEMLQMLIKALLTEASMFSWCDDPRRKCILSLKENLQKLYDGVFAKVKEINKP